MGAVLNLTVTPVADSCSVAHNTSQVAIVVKITTDSGTYSQTGRTLGRVLIDGAEAASLDGKWVYINTTTTLYDAVHTVTHEADGSKSVTVAAEFNVNTPMTGLRTAQTTIALPRIPRCAALTAPVCTLGQAATLTFSGAEGLTWAADYRLGDAAGTVLSRGTEKSVEWTPPVSLARELGSAGEGQATVTVTTWSGETVIGTQDYPVTLLVPDSLAPQVTAVAVSFQSDSVPQAWGAAVKGKTALSYAVTAQGQEGATVTLCRFTCGGAAAEGLAGTTPLLPQAGTFRPRVTVTDSRGKTAVWEGEAITVHDYAAPAFTHSAAFRAGSDGQADDSGTCAAVTASAVCSPVDGHNTVSLRGRYRAVGGTWSGYTALAQGETAVLSGFSVGASYQLEVEAVDALGGSRAVVYSIPTAAVAFHLREGGCGAAFGKYAEHDGWLESEWSVDLRGNRLTGLAAPQEDGDAVPLQTLDARLETAAQASQTQLQQHTERIAALEEETAALEAQLSAAPDMVPGVEYLTGEKWNGAPVYAMVVDYGTLPNSAEGENYALPAGLHIIDMRGFAVGASYIIPIPGYYAVENMGYTRATGNLWIDTTRDLSDYQAYITVKYTK